MRERLQRFMMGRYGIDPLSNFLLILLLVLIVLNFFLRTWIISLLVTLGLIWIYFRMFSRNYQKRSRENEIYMGAKEKILHFFRREKSIAAQHKDFHIYTCPQCRQKIRIPKGKGKVRITCPKCKYEFIKKS